MLVLAAVPDVQFHKLRRAAGSRFNVAQVATWDDVLTSIRGRPVELAVVDPLLSGQERIHHRQLDGPTANAGEHVVPSCNLRDIEPRARSPAEFVELDVGDSC